MIFYFSATGNSAYVAERVAFATNDRTFSITACMKNQNYVFDTRGERQIGIVCPTYCWGLPHIVAAFLEKLEVNTAPDYLWFLTTYGSTTGQIARFAEEILKRKNLNLHGKFCVKMPDTWTPIFDVSDKGKNREINELAELQLDFAIYCIRSGLKEDFMIHKVPYVIAKLFYKTGYQMIRKTSHFHVVETCTGCGMCAENCPEAAIQIKDNRPVWIKKRCEACLACLHHCPKFAIQYGKKTQQHGQYSHAGFIASVKADFNTTGR